MRLSSEFSAGTLWARREWHVILKILKGKYSNLSARLSFTIDRKNFSDKQKLEFSNNKPILKEILRVLL